MSFPQLKWFSTSLVIGISFGFGSGLQIGKISLIDQKRITANVVSKVCNDGRPLSEHSHYLKSVQKNALLDLGSLARSTLKHCLCEGFRGSDCLALKMEISEN